MACPKKKTSHGKQHQRRAKWIALRVDLAKCSNCGEITIPHCACTACGYYNGREYKKSLPRRKQKASA